MKNVRAAVKMNATRTRALNQQHHAFSIVMYLITSVFANQIMLEDPMDYANLYNAHVSENSVDFFSRIYLVQKESTIM